MSLDGTFKVYQRINEWAGKKIGNSATLSGAIDIIVVQHEDGTFVTSPFHVRFGKFNVFNAKEVEVYIEVNEEPVDIYMKLDENGNAVFAGILDPVEEEDINQLHQTPPGSPLPIASSDLDETDGSSSTFYGINGTPMAKRRPQLSRESSLLSRSTSIENYKEKLSKRMISNAALKLEDIFREDNKSLKFSSKIFKALNLHFGENQVEFSVVTAIQGTAKCTCNLFVWKWSDKIVISDIDGTITKSDVRGQVLPKFGKDWAQFGVTSLFDRIAKNGYRIIYLSARPIGQATGTKEYIKSVCQGDIKLPNGPLLLTPDSLLTSFHREVMIKKPEEFKIECMQNIRKLFPEESEPFYSGYGNRSNDVYAYTTVGIPTSRIFTINKNGELKQELTPTSSTSYSNHSDIVDHIFPPILSHADSQGGANAMSYSAFSYWKEPLADVDLDGLTT